MQHNLSGFASRHIGPNSEETKAMLQAMGLSSFEELVEETIPKSLLNTSPLNLDSPLNENEFLLHIRKLASQNKCWKSFLGMGYYGTITPAVIQRNILENPGWYTQYTPYQAEIAQGRLEALLNFQTMVSDLTGMELANASLLDEGTAVAEAMLMCFRIASKKAKTRNRVCCFIDESLFEISKEVVIGKAEPLGIELIFGNFRTDSIPENCFASIVQYPAHDGEIVNYKSYSEQLNEKEVKLIVAADLMSLALLEPPGSWGADVVVGNTQRFGVPMGYGGPHAAYFATKEEFVRQVPGRIIGVSVDSAGKQALRMVLQTREQHIKRDRATSNICTAQALLAIMAGMFAVYNGEDGIKQIASTIHSKTKTLAAGIEKLGYAIKHKQYFDTLLVDIRQHTSTSGLRFRRVAELEEVNCRYFENEDLIGLSIDETTTDADIEMLLEMFAAADNLDWAEVGEAKLSNIEIQVIPADLKRKSRFLENSVFKSYQTETELMRYIKRLENKDLSLVHSMIPLGSCTMKLNAAVQLMPVSFPEFSQLHPFVPEEQAKAYQYIFKELEKDLSVITGLEACSLQPNSGAQGEYAGLMVIRAWHLSRNEAQRNIVLIPTSAHGTNPASAVMAGMKVVLVKCDERGNIDVLDLKDKAQSNKEQLAALMVTYPSTHGVFEEAIKEITDEIHQCGGQVYLDGANMNAQVGLTSPAIIGADVCHLNLHKTFSIPHGGGGPGMGPICVAKHLKPFLPGHKFREQNDSNAISSIASAAWGSASILLVSYAYVKLLGAVGLRKSTLYALLNANYIQKRLSPYFETLYTGDSGRVGHELIIDLRPFKRTINIEVSDVAKRLMDYGFHAPTISFPVVGTMMIEPTESENKEEIDRFCEAMISIREELRALEEGAVSQVDNVLINAPHTLEELTADEWNHEYSRQQAAYPISWVRDRKFWASVSRVNNSYGDRNLVCTCPSIETYSEA